MEDDDRTRSESACPHVDRSVRAGAEDQPPSVQRVLPAAPADERFNVPAPRLAASALTELHDRNLVMCLREPRLKVRTDIGGKVELEHPQQPSRLSQDVGPRLR